MAQVARPGLMEMDYRLWMPYYREIARDLKLDPGKDAMAAKMLADILGNNPKISTGEKVIEEVRGLIASRTVYVLGAGPDLEEELDRLIGEKENKGEWKTGNTGMDILVTADGATSTAVARGMIPHVIVTDMDGSHDDQLMCLSRGSYMFLHAHSDNILGLEQVAPRLAGKIIGTTQVEPEEGGQLINYGGFSDGDRATFIAQHLGAGYIVLLGFNFNEVAEKIGAEGARIALTDEERMIKFKKLTWASVLLGLIPPSKYQFYSENHTIWKDLLESFL